MPHLINNPTIFLSWSLSYPIRPTTSHWKTYSKISQEDQKYPLWQILWTKVTYIAKDLCRCNYGYRPGESTLDYLGGPNLITGVLCLRSEGDVKIEEGQEKWNFAGFKDRGGTSLLVQWLRPHLPMQGVWVRSLVRELRFHMPRGQKTKHKAEAIL